MAAGIGQRIRRERKRRSLSQHEFARRSGVTQPDVWAIEADGQDPRLSTLRKLAKAFGMSVGALVDRTPNRRRVRNRLPIPRITADEAREALAQVAAEFAAWRAAAPISSRRPLSEWLERQRQGYTSHFRSQRAITPEEAIATAMVARHADEGEALVARQRTLVLGLLRAEKDALYRDPVVRQCYEDALHRQDVDDVAFLETFGAALAAWPDRRLRRALHDKGERRRLQRRARRLPDPR